MPGSRTTLALCLLAGALAGCEDLDPVSSGETADLTLDFRGRVGAEGLALEREVYDAAGVAEGFTLSRVSYFLSDIHLVRQVEGQALRTLVDEVAYVEFDGAGRAALTFERVPEGAYTGIEFTVGLTAEQDATSPTDYPAAHPLSRTGEYWVDWESYIFLKVEGRSDTIANGEARYEAPIVYHVGRSAENAATVLLPVAIAVNPGTTEVVELDFDVAALLGVGTSAQVNLGGAIDHGNAAAGVLMGNVPDAFTTR